MPVGVFSSLRNKSSGQVLHSQVLNVSLSVTSLTSSLNFTAFSFLESPLSSPTWGLSVAQLNLEWTHSPGAHPLRSTSVRSSPLAKPFSISSINPMAVSRGNQWLSHPGTQLSEVFALQSLTDIRRGHTKPEICWM